MGKILQVAQKGEIWKSEKFAWVLVSLDVSFLNFVKNCGVQQKAEAKTGISNNKATVRVPTKV